jgi:hypothetical protein
MPSWIKQLPLTVRVTVSFVSEFNPRPLLKIRTSVSAIVAERTESNETVRLAMADRTRTAQYFGTSKVVCDPARSGW